MRPLRGSLVGKDIMEKTALLALLGARDALPVDDNNALSYARFHEAAYRRAAETCERLGLITDYVLHEHGGHLPWETFKVEDVTIDGPFGVLAVKELRDAEAPIERLAGVRVHVDDAEPVEIVGPAADSIRAAVLASVPDVTSTTLAPVEPSDDTNVVSLDDRRQGQGGDVA